MGRVSAGDLVGLLRENVGVTYGDNPARRLLEVLAAAKLQANSTPRAGWAQIFDVPESDLEEILRCGAQVYALARETRESVQVLTDHDPQLVLQLPGALRSRCDAPVLAALHEPC